LVHLAWWHVDHVVEAAHVVALGTIPAMALLACQV